MHRNMERRIFAFAKQKHKEEKVNVAAVAAVYFTILIYKKPKTNAAEKAPRFFFVEDVLCMVYFVVCHSSVVTAISSV